jgi:hypothetical protein
MFLSSEVGLSSALERSVPWAQFDYSLSFLWGTLLPFGECNPKLAKLAHVKMRRRSGRVINVEALQGMVGRNEMATQGAPPPVNAAFFIVDSGSALFVLMLRP